MKLKSAYELASQRIIQSKYQKNIQIEKEEMDYVPLNKNFPEIKSIMIEDKETKPLFNKQKINNKPKLTETIPVKSYNTIHYDKLPQIHWNGEFSTYSGYGRMNRSIVFGLLNKLITINIHNTSNFEHVNKTTLKKIKELEKIEIKDATQQIFTSLNITSKYNGKKILYAMIESSEILNKEYVKKINLFDEIWVANYYNANVCKNSGVKIPIIVMPLGIDFERYKFKETKFRKKIQLKSFVFLSVFEWNLRKGYDIMLQAFMEEFSNKDDVSLLMVTRTKSPHNPNIIYNDFNEIKENINKPANEFPHIALYDSLIPERNMPDIYNVANAFILMSRGEGFCFPICEASAIGLPIIATKCSGHNELLKEEYTYGVNNEGFTYVNDNCKIAQESPYLKNQLLPVFNQKSIETTKQYMREIYEHYDNAKIKSKKQKKYILNNYTWDNTINNIYDKLI